MDTEPEVVEVVVEPVVDPTIELKAKIVELEAIKCKFDAIMKLLNNKEDGGFREFIYWREQSVKDELKRVGFEGCDC